jgi:hypothetical protein
MKKQQADKDDKKRQITETSNVWIVA